jgi:hypothetical protein
MAPPAIRTCSTKNNNVESMKGVMGLTLGLNIGEWWPEFPNTTTLLDDKCFFTSYICHKI